MKNTSIFNKFDGSQNVSLPNASFEKTNGSVPTDSAVHIRSIVSTYGCVSVVRITANDHSLVAFGDPILKLEVHIKNCLRDVFGVEDFKGKLKEVNGEITYNYGYQGTKYTINAFILTNVQDHPECEGIVNGYLGELPEDAISIADAPGASDDSEDFIMSIVSLQKRKYILRLKDAETCDKVYDSLVADLYEATEYNSDFTLEFPESFEGTDEVTGETKEYTGPVAELSYRGKLVAAHICHCPSVYPEK